MARTLWRLTFALFALVISAYALPAVATCSYGTYSAAMTQCQAVLKGEPAGYTWTCQGGIPFGDGARVGVFKNGVDTGGGFFYCTSTVSDMCKARPPLNQSFDGTNRTVTNGGCEYALKSDDDAAVKVCGVWNGKQYCTGSATWLPTGNYTGDPALSPSPTPPAPKVCGGGSCFDPAGNQYCASTGSGQVCVPATSSGNASGCGTGGGTTLCAGVPPPTPPNPPVSDPPSQIASSDNYTSQKGTGTVSNVTVNNFNATGSGAKNGAGSSDLGAPASSSSAPTPPGDGTSAGGGGDCNTPPMVEGSPALGMIARQTWLLRCAEAGQVTDDSNTTVPGLDDVGTTPGDGFSKEVTVLDKLDVSGFGGGTQCPQLPDLDLGGLGHYSLNSDWWCDLLSKTGYMIMMLATWFALRILGEK